MMPIRMVATVLGNGTYGVNAELPKIELDAGDTAPPNVAAIVDESKDGQAARRTLIRGQTTPVLYVMQGEVLEVPLGKTQAGIDADVPVLIAYGGKHSSTEVGKERAWYTMEAVLRTLTQFHSNAKAADRKLANIEIQNARDMQLQMMDEVRGDDRLQLGLLINYQVKDLNPA